MDGSLWVELVGNIIMARIRGEPSEALLRECQDKVLTLLKHTQSRQVLYDALELQSPTVDITLIQQNLSEDLHKMGARVACVVPDTRIAYLSRLAFGSADHRVFYNDMSAAISGWRRATADESAFHSHSFSPVHSHSHSESDSKVIHGTPGTHGTVKGILPTVRNFLAGMNQPCHNIHVAARPDFYIHNSL